MLRLVLILIFQIYAYTAYAYADKVQQDILNCYTPSLQWQNIKKNDLLISSSCPKYDYQYNMDVLRLDPGKVLKVKIPANKILRITCPDNHIKPDNQIKIDDLLQISISNGTGLYVFLPFPTDDKKQSYAVIPDSNTPVICKIFLQDSIKHHVDLSLFLSKQNNIKEPAPYRTTLDLTGSPVSVIQAQDKEKEQFWHLKAHRPTQIRLKGPMRIAIENRLLYPDFEQSRKTSYFFKILMDTKEHSIIDVETLPETSNSIFIDKKPCVCGRIKKSFLNIPEEEHILAIIPYSDMILRVLFLEYPDYVFKNLNAPLCYDKSIKNSFNEKEPIINYSNISQIINDPKTTLAEIDKISQTLSHDNIKPQSALIGATLMERYAKAHPQLSVAKTKANELYTANTFFRNILPYKKSNGFEQKSFKFILPRLKNDYDNKMAVAQQHSQELYNFVQQACFLKIPTESQAFVYKLPKRVAPSKLKIIVTQAKTPQNFFIQFNEKQTTKFCIEPEYDETLDKFQIGNAQAGIAVKSLEKSFSDFIWNSNNFIKPAFFEIDLPTDIDEFRLWGNCESMIAIQYLDSLPYKISESEYLQIVNIIGKDKNLFSEFVNLLSLDLNTSSDLLYSDNRLLNNLKNSWIPLIRMIRSHYALFSASENVDFNKPLSIFPDKHLHILINQAKELEHNNQSIATLEKWSEIFNHSDGKIRDNALFKIADQLICLGETYLAESLLKQIFLKSEKNISDIAFDKLVLFYKNGEAEDRLISLYASRAFLYPTYENIKLLSEILFQEGHDLYALLLGTILPDSLQPMEILVKASINLGWFKMHENLIKNLNNPKKSQISQAKSLLKQSRYDMALQLLDNNQEHEAQTLKKTILQGFDIQKKLLSNVKETRLKGIIDWESWYSNLPGKYSWKQEQDLFVDYDGSVTLYSLSRNLYSSYFRSIVSKPVKAKIYGPLKIRFSVRALHQNNINLPVNGWFSIKDNKQTHVIPIINSSPVQGLEIIGDKNLKPGRQVSYEIFLDKGYHEIEILSHDLPLIVMCEVLRTDSGISNILPKLNLTNVKAAFYGNFKQNFKRQIINNKIDCIFSDCLDIIFPDHTIKTLNMSAFNNELFMKTNKQSLDPNILNNELNSIRDKNKNQNQESLSKKQKIFNKMSELVMQAQKNPDNILEIETKARQLFAENSHLIGLKPLIDKISSKTVWQPVSMIEANAGIKLIDIKAWQPESDMLRIRKALLPQLSQDDHIISKDDNLVFYMTNTEPVTIKAKVTLLDLPILQPAPVTLFYQIDNKPVRQATILPQNPEYMFTQTVLKGNHRLTIGILESYANQFLKVNFCQKQKRCFDIELNQDFQRSFYVATNNDPVKVHILGPTCVRIDKLKDSNTLITYKYLDKGWHLLNLKPDKNETQSLFRVYHRVLKPDFFEQNNLRPVKVHYDKMPEPFLYLKSDPPVQQITFNDQYKLGSQNIGTWSFSAQYHKQLKSQDDQDQGESANIYQISGTHHYFNDKLPGYFKTSFLERLRQDGGPTIGIQEDFFYYPEKLSMAFNLKANLYMQKPNADTFNICEDTSQEYSGLFRAKVLQTKKISQKAYHTPSFSIFGRALSINNENEYPFKILDRDIFSSYKKDHKQGATLSEYFAFMPWLDTLCFLQSDLNSNENLNIFDPDNISIKIGWKQLIGYLQTDIGYRHYYYFSDDDRESDIKRNFIDLDMSWNQWMPDQQRFNIGFNITHDMDNNEYSLLFSLTWFFSKGVALNDIRPGDLDFYNIHKQNIPYEMNNSILKD